MAGTNNRHISCNWYTYQFLLGFFLLGGLSGNFFFFFFHSRIIRGFLFHLTYFVQSCLTDFCVFLRSVGFEDAGPVTRLVKRVKTTLLVSLYSTRIALGALSVPLPLILPYGARVPLPLHQLLSELMTITSDRPTITSARHNKDILETKIFLPHII